MYNYYNSIWYFYAPVMFWSYRDPAVLVKYQRNTDSQNLPIGAEVTTSFVKWDDMPIDMFSSWRKADIVEKLRSKESSAAAGRVRH